MRIWARSVWQRMLARRIRSRNRSGPVTHRSPILFSHDGSYLICGSEDRFVYVWRTQHGIASARRDKNEFYESFSGNAITTANAGIPWICCISDCAQCHFHSRKIGNNLITNSCFLRSSRDRSSRCSSDSGSICPSPLAHHSTRWSAHRTSGDFRSLGDGWLERSH